MIISKNLLKSNIYFNHSLARYTSWKIGGPAEYFYQPKDIDDLKILLQNWQSKNITILGAGTNVLIDDKGITGLVIYLHNGLNKLQVINSNIIRIEAGLSLSHVVNKCAILGITDLSAFAGIPGTIGGALKMNAGAYQNHFWQYINSVETINRNGIIKVRSIDEFRINYRKIEGLDIDEWFIAANINLVNVNSDLVLKKIKHYLNKRKLSQPLNSKNCGSVFKNPTNNYAAKLIENAGLKNKQIGDAIVSEKHANFIINKGKATSNDVKILMQEIVTTVYKLYEIQLIPEVQIL